MKVLVTGAAGFIGYYVARRLAERGDEVVALDNINTYYDVRLKYGRLGELGFAREEAAEATLAGAAGGLSAPGRDTAAGMEGAAGPEAAAAGPGPEATAAAPDVPGPGPEAAEARLHGAPGGPSAAGHQGRSGPEGAPLTSSRYPNLRFVRMDLCDGEGLERLFAAERFDTVCTLAAQAGVRYSLTNPDTYISSNVQGFLNVLEAVRRYPVEHVVYASSSSVYGIDTELPFSEMTAADHPASLYAVSKRSNELTAHSYAHLFGIPTTGLRFFTVYGPWGRPDMALFLFTEAMLAGKPIDVFNQGEMSRDFTYIDDIVEGVVRVLDRPPSGDDTWDGRRSDISPAPYRLFNIGNGAPVRLLDFIEALEAELGVRADRNLLPMQPGDVPATWADCTALEQAVGYRPGTDIRDGIRAFVRWYREFYRP